MITGTQSKAISRYKLDMNELDTAVQSIQTHHPRTLQIIQYPNPMLTQVSMAVIPGVNISPTEMRELLDDMVATMQANRAVGLAAIQIGVPLRMLVVQDQTQQPIRVMNPRIVEMSGSRFEQEGCLSFPGLFLRIARPAEVVVEYFDENLEVRRTGLGGLLGRAIQHEIDHLDGKTFLDRVSKVGRSNALTKIKAVQRKFKRFATQLVGGQ